MAFPRPWRAARGLVPISAARTDSGAVRKANEDSLLDRPDMGLWAVADGMGGHQRGDLASRLVVEALETLPRPAADEAGVAAARAALQAANRGLVAQAQALGPNAVIGSTVVALMGRAGRYACLWAGDSRAYLMKGGRLRRLSHDHSVVQELVDRGEITLAEARTDPRARFVTRAVGAGDDLRLDLAEGALETRDLFLLCSDGLTGVVADDELAGLLDPEAMEASADALMDLALRRGAPDNVTLVLVTFRPG